MRPSLETTPKTITVAENFVFITLGTLNHLDLHFEGAGNGPVIITWIGREHELYNCYIVICRCMHNHILSATSLVPNLIRGPEGPFGLAWLSLPHLISNFSGPQLSPKLHQGSQGCGFLYHILSPTCLIPNSSGPQGPLRPGVAFPTPSPL